MSTDRLNKLTVESLEDAVLEKESTEKIAEITACLLVNLLEVREGDSDQHTEVAPCSLKKP